LLLHGALLGRLLLHGALLGRLLLHGALLGRLLLGRLLLALEIAHHCVTHALARTRSATSPYSPPKNVTYPLVPRTHRHQAGRGHTVSAGTTAPNTPSGPPSSSCPAAYGPATDRAQVGTGTGAPSDSWRVWRCPHPRDGAVTSAATIETCTSAASGSRGRTTTVHGSSTTSSQGRSTPSMRRAS